MYHPDCNSPKCVGEISLKEIRFAKLKAHLRKAGERSVLALWDRIGTILQTFTPDECSQAPDMAQTEGIPL